MPRLTENIEFKNKIKPIFNLCLSYILTFVLFKFFDLTFPYSEVLFVAAMFGTYYLILNSYKILDKSIRIGSAIFSLFLSLSFVIGRKINLWEKPYFEYFKFSDLIYWALIGLFLFFAVVNILNFSLRIELNMIPSNVDIKLFFIVFLMLVIAWTPYLLVYYPGNLSPDSIGSIKQAIGISPYSNHHPIMFTIFVKIFINLGLLFGDLNFGIACFSFAQILVLSSVLSYSIYWFKKKGIANYILFFITLFFALNPIIAMYSITMWKDVMFAGWILLFMMLLYDIVESNGELLCSFKSLSLLIIVSLLVSFSRNNGFYVVIIVLVTITICFRKYYKFLLPTFLSTVLLICIIQGPVYNLLGVKQSGFAESVGIPLQQIGYTLEEEGTISDSQEKFLNNLLPVDTIVESYNPISPDYIKFDPKFNNDFLNSNKGKFLRIWLEILPSNFPKYIKAWIMQTIGYYHIETRNWVVFYGIDPVEKDSCLSLGIFSTDFIEKNTHISLQNTIKKIVNLITKCPLIKNIYSIAFMVWMTFFCTLTMLLKNRSKYIITLVPLIAIWITMMIAAPTFCEFRYMFSFHLAIPFLILLIFIKSKDKICSNV